MSNKIKKKQIQNQAQDGRSMVEMLGVLAIVGVLSIGGIAGYRMVINRYQANQIANEINLMRTDAKMKAAQGAKELLLGSPYDDEKHLNFGSNYGVEFDFAEIGSDDASETEAGYYIKVSGVSAGVCKPLITLLNSMEDAVALVVNEQEYSADSSADLCTEESDNALEVDFSTKDIGGMKVCNPDKCEGKCTEDGECESCPEGTTWNGDECACPSGKHWNEEIQACAACGDNSHCTSSSKPACIEGVCSKCTEESQCDMAQNKHCKISTGQCITCGISVSAAVWNETAQKCDYCKNVYPDKPNWTGSECVAECSGDKPFLYNNQCVECRKDEHCQKDDRQHYWCDTSYSANYGTCKPCYSWDEDNQHCQRGECESNEDCGANEFCRSSSCNDATSSDASGCGKFECVEIKESDIIKGNVGGKDCYGSKINLNWQSAERFCEAAKNRVAGAQGKRVSWGGSGIDWKCYSGADNTDHVPTTNEVWGFCKATSGGYGANNVSETIRDLWEMYCGDRENGCVGHEIWLNDGSYTSYLAKAVFLYGDSQVFDQFHTVWSYHPFCQ